MESSTDFVDRWRILMLHLIEASCELMQEELLNGNEVAGLVVYPMDASEWQKYQAEKGLSKAPAGELS